MDVVLVQALRKDLAEVTEEVGRSREVLGSAEELGGEDQAVMEEALDCLAARLGALDSVVGQHCNDTRRRMQELAAFQVCVCECAFVCNVCV